MTKEQKFVSALLSIEQLIAAGGLKEAAQHLNALFRAQPNDPRLFILGSQLALASGNPKGRLEGALSAAKVAPEWPVAALLVAQAYLEQNQREEALNWARKAVATGQKHRSLDVPQLERAAFLAQGAGDGALALEWLQAAIDMEPTQTALRYKKALILTNSGQYEAAVSLLTELLNADPENVALLEQRMKAGRVANRMDLVAADSTLALKLEPNNPTFQFYYALSHDQTPAAFSPDMVKELFDVRAAQFDQHLVVSLNYKLPKDVAARIRGWYPELDCDILDLGCGTGLLGACLGPCKGVLVGVDLSTAMIQQAEKHAVYDKFYAVDVVKALESTPAGEYDVLTALDVFVYLGELDSLIANAHKVLTAGGRFVFSCEKEEGVSAGFRLHSALRYSHTGEYLEKCLKAAGFSGYTLEDFDIRLERGEPVKGILCVAQK